jgi:hypothetical protein
MTKIEDYALNLVANGAESHTEDDIDEDGEFGVDDINGEPTAESEADHKAAVDLAMAIIRAIRDNPQTLLGMVRDAADAEETP